MIKHTPTMTILAATHRNALQRAALEACNSTAINTLQQRSSSLQRTATNCNSLQHAATEACNSAAIKQTATAIILGDFESALATDSFRTLHFRYA